MALQFGSGKPVPEPVARNAIGGVLGGCAAIAGFAFHWPWLFTVTFGLIVAVIFWVTVGVFYNHARKRGFPV